MDEQQQQRFAEAVERKKDASRERSQVTSQQPGDLPVHEEVQASEVEHGRPQDVYSIRDKNSGKGKKTADKWNQ